jgi:hypothetical protein
MDRTDFVDRTTKLSNRMAYILVYSPWHHKKLIELKELAREIKALGEDLEASASKEIERLDLTDDTLW